MESLTIENMGRSGSLDTMKITGFADGELQELKSLDHYTASEKLLEMLDERNGGVGTCWKCGYGAYGVWFDNEAAYMNIGRSAD